MTTSQDKSTGEVAVIQLPAKLCYSLYIALMNSPEFTAEHPEDRVASFWADNNVIHLYHKKDSPDELS